MKINVLVAGICVSLLAGSALGEITENPARDAYFGDTHLHTAYSLDAYLGGTRLLPADAYRFAMGETVTINGEELRISKPLDFAAVTDHAEYMGEMASTLHEGVPGHDDELLKELRSLDDFNDREAWFTQYVVSSNRSSTPQRPPFFAGVGTIKTAWEAIIEANEEYNQPGIFTTIPGFEWSAAPEGGNLHRNILFRDANVPEIPASYIDQNREEELWAWMAAQEKRGARLFAMPHNSNASKLMMFSPNDSKGNPIDAEYAQMRAHFEPLIEMMQIKGNSEVTRKFWGADEFSDFENADSMEKYSGRVQQRENYVRYGLAKGLEYEKKLGVNPYQYGIVGGTDNHNGAMGNTAEDNWRLGSHGTADGSVERRRKENIAGWIDGIDLNPGALTGVWATSNTRGAIWDAMRRKETFGTSGPRIKARFFGGYTIDGAVEDYGTMVADGDQNGVPMGGMLDIPVGGTVKPTFTVWAEKEEQGANLDRIQLIKSWLDNNDELQEKIVEVAWSDDRERTGEGSLQPVGNTVDLTTATYTNDIGEEILQGSWTDEEFNAKQHALYYVRVLQIPTPRWSTYDAVRNNLSLPEDVPASVQERLWTSPIWYNPNQTR